MHWKSTRKRTFSARRIYQAREDAAKEKIYSILPEDQKQELIGLFDEFEAYETAEARFVHAMDNLQPLLLKRQQLGRRLEGTTGDCEAGI